MTEAPEHASAPAPETGEPPAERAVVFVVFDAGAELGPQIGWAMRFAATRGARIRATVNDPSVVSAEKLAAHLRRVLDDAEVLGAASESGGKDSPQEKGAQQKDAQKKGAQKQDTQKQDTQKKDAEQKGAQKKVVEKNGAEKNAAGKASADKSSSGKPSGSNQADAAELTQEGGELKRAHTILAAIRASKPEALLIFRSKDDQCEQVRAVLIAQAPCEVTSLRLDTSAEVSPPDSTRPLRVLVPLGRGAHARAALVLAQKLAGEDGVVTALYIEPDIGLDADLVGHKVLDRLVRTSVGDNATGQEISREVVVSADVPEAIAKFAGEDRFDIVLIGATKRGALGQRLRGTISAKVAKLLPTANVALVRAPLPITGRLRTAFERWALHNVPQLRREQRVELVERVQSNSFWDFDFVAMMSLSTAIAAIGLVLASESIVIGGMLVAPLMTPLLGLGLALVHGNPVLARRAMRSVGLGFLVAFGIGWVLGALHPSFEVPTSSMLSRHWPGLLDLVVAFVAGFAGAYATSRPNLTAALPGVAIAAALVPPIATSGLAVASGAYALGVGAAMLFVTNMVAIVFASSLCLWAVGLRELKPKSTKHQWAGRALTWSILGMGVWFAADSPYDVSNELRALVAREASASGVAVESIRRNWSGELVVEVGGVAAPSASIASAITNGAHAELGEDVSVRVVWVWSQRAR